MNIQVSREVAGVDLEKINPQGEMMTHLNKLPTHLDTFLAKGRLPIQNVHHLNCGTIPAPIRRADLFFSSREKLVVLVDAIPFLRALGD